MIHYKIFGSGDPVVILHGLFGMLDNWKSFATRLSKTHQVITVDLRNHGRSFWSDEFNYRVMVDDIIELMDFLDIDRSVILGHSMGGKVALQLANTHAEKINQLIVVDIGYRAYKPSHERIFQTVLDVDATQISSRNEANEILKPGIPQEAVRQFLLKSLARNKEGGYEWRVNFPVLWKSYPQILGAVDVEHIICPSLFIRGSRSDYIQESEIQDLESVHARSNVVTVDAGHWIHAESPVELLNIVLSFLNEKV